jgi:hypothetical protein
MRAAASNSVWGLDRNSVSLSACWSGYRSPSNPASYDYPAIDPNTGAANTFAQCTINGVDPITNQTAVACPAPATVASDDTASDQPGGDITVYLCYRWKPPMAGFFLIPSTISLQAVVTEIIQRQQ